MLIIAASLISMIFAAVLMIIMVIDILAILRMHTRHSWAEIAIDLSLIIGMSCTMMVSGQVLISNLIPA